jgi:hypothetical protein
MIPVLGQSFQHPASKDFIAVEFAIVCANVSNSTLAWQAKHTKWLLQYRRNPHFTKLQSNYKPQPSKNIGKNKQKTVASTLLFWTSLFHGKLFCFKKRIFKSTNLGREFRDIARLTLKFDCVQKWVFCNKNFRFLSRSKEERIRLLVGVYVKQLDTWVFKVITSC